MDVIQLRDQLQKQSQQFDKERQMISNEFLGIINTRNEQIQALTSALKEMTQTNLKIRTEREKLIKFINEHEFGSNDVDLIEKEQEEKLKLQQNLKTLESAFFTLQNEANQLKNQNQEFSQLIQIKENEVEKINKEKQRIIDKNSEDNLLLFKHIDDLEAKLNNFSDGTDSQKTGKENQGNQEMAEQIRVLQENIKKLEEEKSKNPYENEHFILVEHIENLEKKIQQLENEKKNPENSELLLKHINTLEETIKKLESEKQKNHQDIQNTQLLIEHIEHLEAQIKQKDEDNKILLDSISQQNLNSSQIDDLTKEIKNLRIENETLKKESMKNSNSSEVIRLKEELVQLKQKLNNYQSKNFNIEDQGLLISRIEELEKENERLNLQSRKNQSQDIDELRKQLQEEKSNNELLIQYIQQLNVSNQNSKK
eukprot:Anaeramoba_ignava/a98115_32.p1 GENE.a98115_32~~a98115_32.p1  ORF type:complete len:437 (+),score=175.03 a98115_32:34-1311(+)